MRILPRKWFPVLWLVMFVMLLAGDSRSIAQEGALRDDGSMYLEEPEPDPPPTVVRRFRQREMYDEENVRVEREVIQLSDDSIVNHGAFREYYRDGKKFSEGAFKNGVHDAVWTYWYPNGQVRKKVSFLKGKPSGTWDVFREDGTREVAKSYKDGIRNGKWQGYYEDGETVRVEINYLEGLPHGERKAFRSCAGWLSRE